MKKLLISFFMVALLFLPVRVFSENVLPGELAKEKSPQLYQVIDQAYQLLSESQKVYRENIFVVENVDIYIKNFCGENCSAPTWKKVKLSLENNNITVITIESQGETYIGVYINSKSNWCYDLAKKYSLGVWSEDEKAFSAAALAAALAHEKFHVDNPLADEVEAHQYEKKIFKELSSKLGFDNREGSVKYLSVLDQKIAEAKNEQAVASVIRIRS